MLKFGYFFIVILAIFFIFNCDPVKAEIASTTAARSGTERLDIESWTDAITLLVQGTTAAGGRRNTGFTFTNIQIPKNSTINSATITGTIQACNGSGDYTNGYPPFTLFGVLDNNFWGFSATSSLPSYVYHTENYVFNNDRSCSVGATYEIKNATNTNAMVDVISEMVSDPDWLWDNNFTFFLISATSSNVNRYFTPSSMALNVNYTPPDYTGGTCPVCETGSTTATSTLLADSWLDLNAISRITAIDSTGKYIIYSVPYLLLFFIFILIIISFCVVYLFYSIRKNK